MKLVSSRAEQMRASSQDDVLSPPECALTVLRDVYYMKLIAVEVVSQLALDTIAFIPRESGVFLRLVEQVHEEFEHLNHCRSVLAGHEAFGVKPPYVRQFARMMRSYGGRRHRTLPLAVAVILCISVERSAMQQLARASVSKRQISHLLHTLGTDEEEHYDLVVRVVAPCVAARASLLERMLAYLIMLQITLVTLTRWWPRRVGDYQSLGLNVGRFVEDMLDYASTAMRPLGLLFPRSILLRLTKMVLPSS